MRRWFSDSKWNMEYGRSQTKLNKEWKKKKNVFHFSGMKNCINDFDDTKIKFILMSRDAIRWRKCINAWIANRKVKKLYVYSHRSRIIIIIRTTKPIFHLDVLCRSWFGFMVSFLILDTSCHSKNDEFYIFYVSYFHFNCSYLVLGSLAHHLLLRSFPFFSLSFSIPIQIVNVKSSSQTLWPYEKINLMYTI